VDDVVDEVVGALVVDEVVDALAAVVTGAVVDVVAALVVELAGLVVELVVDALVVDLVVVVGALVVEVDDLVVDLAVDEAPPHDCTLVSVYGKVTTDEPWPILNRPVLDTGNVLHTSILMTPLTISWLTFPPFDLKVSNCPLLSSVAIIGVKWVASYVPSPV